MSLAFPIMQRFDCNEFEGGILVAAFRDPSMLSQKIAAEVCVEIQRLSACECAHLIFDFGVVYFLSSDVLGALIKAEKACRRRSVTIKFAAIKHDTSEVFAITRLNTLFDIQPDVAQAVAACRT